MKFFKGLDDLDKSPKVVTLGNFDGVHKGHVELISQAVNLGAQKELPSYVLSFYPHPKSFFNQKIKYINTLEEKKENIKRLGADAFVVMEFNREIASLTKDSFVEEILVKRMNAKVIIVGYDFLFGKNRQGNVETLKETASQFGIEVHIIPPVKVDGKRVSSSLIRKFFSQGEITKVNKFLGYYPRITGRVIPGKQLARRLGFPTANIDYDKEQLLPNNGVYSAKVCIDGVIYLGTANIGVKPTVKEDRSIEIEVHILDFAKDIYEKEITVFFIEKIRDEIKFSSLEDLKKQINEDIKKILPIDM